MPVLAFDQLEEELRSSRLHPVYLLWGPEELLRRRAISLISDQALTSGSAAFDFSEYSGLNGNIDEILGQANTFPMISPMRLIIVSDVEKFADAGQDKICAYAEDPQSRTVLILESAALDRRTKFFKHLSRNACAVEFPKLKGMSLERWTRDFLARRGMRISTSALGKLMYLAGSDAQSLANEIEKLILYAGKEREITESSVEAVVGASRLHSIFELTGALGARNKKLALRLLSNLLGGGEPALIIITMMARHFRQVIIAKELLERGSARGEIGRIAQVPEFILGEFLRHARATPRETARMLQERLAEIDYRCKSSSPDEQMLLEHLICSL